MSTTSQALSRLELSPQLRCVAMIEKGLQGHLTAVLCHVDLKEPCCVMLKSQLTLPVYSTPAHMSLVWVYIHVYWTPAHMSLVLGIYT